MKRDKLTNRQEKNLALVKDLILDYFHIEDFIMDRKRENVTYRLFYYYFAKQYTPYPWGVIACYLKQDHATALHAHRAFDNLLSYDKHVQNDYEELKIIFENEYTDTSKKDQIESLIKKYTLKIDKLKLEYYELTNSEFENKEDIQIFWS